jgi:hypothetical protein
MGSRLLKKSCVLWESPTSERNGSSPRFFRQRRIRLKRKPVAENEKTRRISLYDLARRKSAIDNSEAHLRRLSAAWTADLTTIEPKDNACAIDVEVGVGEKLLCILKR